MTTAQRPNPFGRPFNALLTVSVLACFAWFWLSAMAFAHASLVRTAPSDDAVLKEVPAAFSMTFSEPVSPLVLKLIKPDGSSVSLDRFVLDDRTLEIGTPADLGHGTHVLSWRVVSEDGHPVAGSLVFSIGAQTTDGKLQMSNDIPWSLRGLIWLSKFGLYLGLFFGVGGAFFEAWIAAGSRLIKGSIFSAISCGLVAAPLSVALQGLDALGLPLPSLKDLAVWESGLGTSYGNTALIAGIALFMGLSSLNRRRVRVARALSLLSLLGVGLSLAASGHASAASPQWLTRPAVFLHGVGIAFWIGSLLPLIGLMGSRADAAGVGLRRFSRVVPLALVLLVGAGITLAIVQTGTPAALFQTVYGTILLAKLSLLIVLFGIAAINRWYLTDPAAAGNSIARRRLRQCVSAEVLIVVAVMGLSALWRFTPPPRTLETQPVQLASAHIHTPQAMAELTINRNSVGFASMSVIVQAADSRPLPAKEVTLVLANPHAGIEPFKRHAAMGEGGVWKVPDVQLPLPGCWSVRIDILVTDFKVVKLEDTVTVEPALSASLDPLKR